MSRLRTFALLAAVLAATVALAACGGSSSGGSDEDPQKVLDNATLEGVDSGNIDLSLSVKAEGKEGGDVDVSVSGPFQAGATKESLPQLDMTASASGTAAGEDVDFEGGLTLLSDRAFVEYEGTEYEVDPTTFGFVRSGFEKGVKEGNGEGEGTACQEAAAGFKVGDFAQELKNEGSADVDGTGTTKVSGDLDVSGAIDAIEKLVENPACSAQLESAGPLPLDELDKAKGELTSAIKNAHVDVYVGSDDDIIRRIAAELTIEPKDSGSAEKVEIDFDLTLSGVNEEQTINPPSGAKPLDQLFQKLGVNPLELLEMGSDPSAGLGSLLEGVTGSSSGGSGGGSGGGNAYLECLEGAETPADLQKCASQQQ